MINQLLAAGSHYFIFYRKLNIYIFLIWSFQKTIRMKLLCLPRNLVSADDKIK